MSIAYEIVTLFGYRSDLLGKGGIYAIRQAEQGCGARE